MIKKESVLTLSDNKQYVVVEIVKYKEETYLYLVDIDNNLNYMFGKLEKDNIEEILDKELLKILIDMIIK